MRLIGWKKPESENGLSGEMSKDFRGTEVAVKEVTLYYN
jgi:hypothetical protein